jgi:hypothetical protein
MTEFDYYDIETGVGVSDYELHQRYDSMLDDCYDWPTVAGYGYPVASTLQLVDPIAYRCGFADWLDSELGETLSEGPPPAG